MISHGSEDAQCLETYNTVLSIIKTGQLFSSTFDIMFKITDLMTIYNIKSSNEKAVGDKKFCCRSCLSDI